jgi:hypothetical protein
MLLTFQSKRPWNIRLFFVKMSWNSRTYEIFIFGCKAGEQIRARPTLATAMYCPSCPGMQADTRAIRLPSPATRDVFFVRVHEAAFRREEANNGCGPVLIKSWRLSLHPTTRCLKAASSFCQSRPPPLLQKTLRDCDATASHDVDEQCIRGSWGSVPR